MLSVYHLLFLLLTIPLISSEEITAESILSNLLEMSHEKTYHEIRDNILPSIHRMSRKIQSSIIKTTEQYKKMQVCLYS
jgi:hypothetical protein